LTASFSPICRPHFASRPEPSCHPGRQKRASSGSGWVKLEVDSADKRVGQGPFAGNFATLLFFVLSALRGRLNGSPAHEAKDKYMDNEKVRLIDLIEGFSAEKKVFFRPMSLVGDIMNEEVRTLTLDHTVKACFEYMEKHRIRHVPVINRDFKEQKALFVGVVSDRDVLRQVPSSGLVNKKGKDTKDKRALRQLLMQLIERKPKTVPPDALVSEAITMMLDNHIDGVPVVEEGELVGMITTGAMLRIYSRLESVIRSIFPELGKAKKLSDVSEGAGEEEMILKRWIFKPVKEIMTRGPLCLSKQDTLEKAIKVLQEGEFRHAPVVNQAGQLEGLISDRDILRHLPFAGRRPPRPDNVFRGYLFSVKPNCKSVETPVEEIMVPARKVKTASPETTLCEVAALMKKKKISSLPVVDEERNLLGILTITNLMCELLRAYEVPQCAAAMS
jgi:CBS domain-containing protein